ncbi:MAG: ATP-binding cassette domain-containing protein [Gorillibacterium sp.]|nr:ATP-binding cassette domain-containing protein [Gorillibacterium sp.]
MTLLAKGSARSSEVAAAVSNLRLKFPGEDTLVFQGLSFSIRQGEKVLLLGPSGCGKSTLLQVLSGIIPRAVEVPMKTDELKVPMQPGFVFQDPDTQFCMPYVDEEIAFVLENLATPREEMPALIQHYLDQVGLHVEPVHTPIQQLSQGMKQRLAIASVLALTPDVLMLDEPTALLDEEGTKQVWDTIRAIASDKTVLIVEHKITGILDFIDRIVVFSPDGKIIADGGPEQVFRDYRRELMEYGIWYPGVWDDYAESQREADGLLQIAEPSVAMLSMEQFEGLRGGESKVMVECLKAYAGDWIAVIGRNGAGKSSLLLAIMRLIRTKGTCRIAGARGTKVVQLAEKIAFVFQNPELQFVTNSVEDELAYTLSDTDVLKPEVQAAVERQLDYYDLTTLRARHPFQLSTGQKWRLSVASAMVGGQKILLLDEPTFGLDARNTFQLLTKLEQLRQDNTLIIMVTHDPEIVRRFATRVWQVSDGRVTEVPLESGLATETSLESDSGQALAEGGADSGCH